MRTAPGALAPFTAQRIDYSLARLAHYTATLPEHFQNHVLFTNYQFYIDEFVAFARDALADPESGYTALVGPGNDIITEPRSAAEPAREAAADADLSPDAAMTGPGSRWSISGWGRRTRRRRPTTSPCCARMPG
jgi:hypothetical protein